MKKETPTKKTSTIFETKVNSVSKIDNENSVPEFNSYHGKNKSTIKNYIKFNRNIRLVGSLSVIMLMVIGVGIIVPYYIKSAETEAAGESHFGDALLTFSSESLAASVTLSNLAAGGSFATSTTAQQAKFSISTTNYTGYTLAIQAAEDTVLSGTKGGSLTAIPQSVTTAQYTANNISNVNLNNTWGFLPNYYKSGSNIVANTDTYLPISTTDSTILDETTSANTEAKQYTISLGARADYTNTVDTFSNTFILQYIANPVNYAVTYDKNAGSDTVTNMPYENNTPQYVQAGHVEATSITLSNLIPLRNNYTFLGWCSEATGTPVDNSDTCAGIIYNDQAEGATPNLTFNLSQTSANTATLYAMWHQELKTNINQLATMQDFASLSGQEYVAVLGSMTEGQSYQLKDSRDDKTYNIAKLKGGNVWLQDNLQLDIAANKENITPTNTNANNDALTCLKSGCSSSTIYSQAAAANTSASNWTNNSTYNYYTQAMYNKDNANYNASYGNGTHKSGYYYNYCAASAGSYCYAAGASTGNATQDICPAGWQMPAGDSSTYSYQKLYEAYGSDYAAFKNALHAGFSGYFYGRIDGQGGLGLFWASTFNNASSMRRLSVDASSVSPQNVGGREVGFSVRCVLNPSGLDTNITFSPNGADSGSVTTLTLASGSDSLPYDTFTKSGYIITSWNTASDGSGTTYAAGTPVTAGMNGLTLYAQWSVGSWMQDMRIASKDTQCPSTANTTVYDKRDGKAYTAKQMDGYCIMTKNLAYIGGNNGTASAGNAVSANGTSFSMTSSTSSSYTSPYYYNSNNNSYGVYYNYCAASGKQQCISSSSAGSVATDSICPAGWKLPTSPSNTSWGGISISTIVKNSGNFNVYAGYYGSGSPSGVGSNGCWWSATPRAGYPYDSRYFLGYNGSVISAQNSFKRDYLVSVRCMLSR